MNTDSIGITITIGGKTLYNFIFDWGYNNDDFIQNRITVYFRYLLSDAEDGTLVKKCYNITEQEFADSNFRKCLWKHFEADPDKENSTYTQNLSAIIV